MSLTREEIEKVFENEDTEWKGDNAYQGLQILAKYSDNLIQGAAKDVIYSCGISELIEKGITKEDVDKLRKLNWMLEDGEYLACFV